MRHASRQFFISFHFISFHSSSAVVAVDSSQLRASWLWRDSGCLNVPVLSMDTC